MQRYNFYFNYQRNTDILFVYPQRFHPSSHLVVPTPDALHAGSNKGKTKREACTFTSVQALISWIMEARFWETAGRISYVEQTTSLFHLLERAVVAPVPTIQAQVARFVSFRILPVFGDIEVAAAQCLQAGRA